MPRTFEKIGARDGHKVYDQLVSVRDRYHGHLRDAGVTIDVLLVRNVTKDGEEIDPALKLHGDACKATIKINSYEARVKGECDVTLKIDGHHYDEWTDAELDAILDHELFHLALVVDKDGGVKRDDCGRPKLKTVPHDFVVGGFNVVADRHKGEAAEVQAVAEIGKMGVRQGWFQGF